jgi:hypothetical protein
MRSIHRIRNQAGLLILLGLSATDGWPQTRVNLGHQARNVDFASAPFTRPSRTGSSLPVNCAAGETFLKTDSIPGENLYVCGNNSDWGLVGTTTGASANTCRVAVTGTLLTIGTAASTVSPCTFRVNDSYFVFTQPRGVTITGGTGSGTARIYLTSLGVYTVEYSSGATFSADTGVLLIENSPAEFPVSALRLATVPFSSGQWGTLIDERANAGSRELLHSGTGIAAIQHGVIAIDSTVPQKGADNVWTGQNDFSAGNSMKLQRAAGAPATGCTAAAEVGKIVVNSSGAEGSHLWVCENNGGSPRWTAVNAGTAPALRTAGAGAFVPPTFQDNGFQTLATGKTYFQQVVLPFAMSAARVNLSLNGGGGAGQAAAVGIYDQACNLVSGAQARVVGLNTAGRLTFTFASPVVLAPGVYHFGLAAESETAQFSVSGNGSVLADLLNPATEARLFTGAAPAGSGATFAVPASCGTKTAGAQPVANFAWLP